MVLTDKHLSEHDLQEIIEICAGNPCLVNDALVLALLELKQRREDDKKTIATSSDLG